MVVLGWVWQCVGQVVVEVFVDEVGVVVGEVDEFVDQVGVDVGDEVVQVQVEIVDIVGGFGGEVVVQCFWFKIGVEVGVCYYEGVV